MKVPVRLDARLAPLSTLWRTILGAWHGFKSLCAHYSNLSDSQQMLPTHVSLLEIVGVGQPQEKVRALYPRSQTLAHMHTFTHVHVRKDGAYTCVSAHSQLHAHMHRHAIQACAHTHMHVETNTHTITYAHTDITYPQACRLIYVPTCTYRGRHTGTQIHTLPCTSLQAHTKLWWHTEACTQWKGMCAHTVLWQMRINTWLDLRGKRQPARPTHTLSFVSLFPTLLL